VPLKLQPDGASLAKELRRRQGFSYRPVKADVQDTRLLELRHERVVALLVRA